MSSRALRPYRRLQRWRRALQAGGLLLPVLIAVLVLLEIRPVLGSYYALSIGPVDLVDPAMALQTLLLSRTASASLLVALIPPVLIALLLGRVFCGWVCPYNTILEAWWALERRIASDRHRRRRRRASTAGNPRPRTFWAVLLGLVALVPLSGFPLLSYLSPPGLSSSQTTQALLGMGLGLELGLVGLLFAAEAGLGRRFWCRRICPVGGVLGAMRLPGSLRVQHDADACRCHALIEPCHLACPVDLVPKRAHLYPSCLQCGLCLKACEATGHGALRFIAGPSPSQARTEA